MSDFAGIEAKILLRSIALSPEEQSKQSMHGAPQSDCEFRHRPAQAFVSSLACRFHRTLAARVEVLWPVPDAAGSIEIGGSIQIGERTLIDLAVAAGLTSTAPDFRIAAAIPVRQ